MDLNTAAAILRPLGFLLMMLGFGVRLDSSWQVLGWLLLSAGGLIGGAGLLALGRARSDAEAFVPGDGRG